MFKRTAVPPVGSSELQARQPLNMALGLFGSFAMRFLSVIVFLILSGLAFATENSTSPERLKPGHIISESLDRQIFEFKGVSRSVVNSPQASESVGHFSFILFRDFEVCQCSLSEVSISPKGRYLVFVSIDGSLTVFDSKTLRSVKLNNSYVGYPYSARWLFDQGQIELTVIEAGEPDGRKTVLTFDFALEPEA
jgi:hypothetical protein